ncbi:MAG: hypothetical protein JXR41_01770 [Bacteroidales bacterium]|nr:hypothetical protein [Bacteroidales bacterium]MBN2761788.1 hypothetical protein [Bacteroidales bacterium]
MLQGKPVILCYCIILNCLSELAAQTSNNPVSARYAGMAGAGIVFSDAWSVFQNQAGLAAVSDLSLGLHYENHFFIPENSIKAIAACIPVLKGVIGLNHAQFGYSKYYESRSGLAFGKSFGTHFSAGIQINYLMIHQPADFGNMHAVIPEGGILAQPFEKLFIGFHIFNPVQQHFPQYHEQAIPSTIKAGIGYSIVENVFLILEAGKEIKKKQVIRAGFEYMMTHNLTLCLGASTDEISRYAVGLGYRHKGLSLDFALSHHRWLGYTPYVTLTYSRSMKR